MTHIEFDKNGKPSWRNVDTNKFQVREIDMRWEFTDMDMQWFRKPLERSAR